MRLLHAVRRAVAVAGGALLLLPHAAQAQIDPGLFPVGQVWGGYGQSAMSPTTRGTTVIHITSGNDASFGGMFIYQGRAFLFRGAASSDGRVLLSGSGFQAAGQVTRLASGGYATTFAYQIAVLRDQGVAGLLRSNPLGAAWSFPPAPCDGEVTPTGFPPAPCRFVRTSVDNVGKGWTFGSLSLGGSTFQVFAVSAVEVAADGSFGIDMVGQPADVGREGLTLKVDATCFPDANGGSSTIVGSYQIVAADGSVRQSGVLKLRVPAG